MNDYDKMRERHYNGTCGGGCSECVNEQEQDIERRRYEESIQEAARCDAEGHPHHSDGRCYCGTLTYKLVGSTWMPDVDFFKQLDSDDLPL